MKTWLMRKIHVVVVFGFMFGVTRLVAQSAEPPDSSPASLIKILTSRSQITLMVGTDRHLYQLGFGLTNAAVALPKKTPGRDDDFYPSAGDGYVFEPALKVTHADGNTSTDLEFVRSDYSELDSNVSLTRIELRDAYYPFHVFLNFKTYRAEDVIEEWAEYVHEETNALTLERFASAAPEFPTGDYWLTQFHGDWAKEAQMTEEKLTFGIKVLDSKLGVRAQKYRTPVFLLSRNGPAAETTGEIYGGALGWSGSYQFAFEMNPQGRLRTLAGINPFDSAYHLRAGELFSTPKMFWSWSDAGAGQVSRNFHRWARKYILRHPENLRPVLLNNWEATRFDFNETKLLSLFDSAKALGAEVFLLDDGWFGERFPRDNDHAGLGDWQVNPRKLPHGLSYLAKAAAGRGLGFGIWLEPEMVNPESELYQRHPDWVIAQPHRPLDLQRNQLVLDLTRPATREFSWSAIDRTLRSNPGITFMKWDCNRFITQPGSSYLPAGEQSHLWIDYVRALYGNMDRFATNFPDVMGMLCAGGGGRVDFEALRRFDSFWPSDCTDPLDRVFIQWGYSYFYPACAMAAHVTRMGNRPFKFTLDVAMSGALGFDVDWQKLSPQQRTEATAAVALYKEDLRPIVQQGDLYRLVSPYHGQRSAFDYVSADCHRSVLFVYQIGSGNAESVKLAGLDPQGHYHVSEVNLSPGKNSHLPENGRVLDGAALMRDGLNPDCTRKFDSEVIELTADH